MSAPEAPKPVRPPLFSRRARLFAALLLVVGGTLAVVSLRGEPKREVRVALGPDRAVVTPAELAAWGIEGRRDYVVVDLRPDDDFREGHVRGAVSCGTCHETVDEGRSATQGDTFVDLTKRVVLYTETGTESVSLPPLLARNHNVALLKGGYAAWKAEVLAPVAFGGEVDEAEIAAKRKREAVRAFYAGERVGSAVPAVLPVAPIRRQSPHAPAKPSEGC